MALPLAFLLGLLVVVANREAGGSLPGECTAEGLLWCSSVLAVPWLLAALARRFAVYSLVTGRAPAVPPRALLRLSALGTPLALHALFVFGAYNDCVDRLAPSSHSLRILLALTPLYLTELPRIVMATMASGLVEAAFATRESRQVSPKVLPRWRDVWPMTRLSFGWPLLTLLPALLLGGCMDLLQLHRPSYVFVFVTSVGLTMATVAFLVITSMVLPFWFRIAFGARADFPEPLGNTLRQAAKSLGFSPKRIFVLPTGMRAMNAMMVGPLPIGRLLCLTDGLLATLDPRSLTGVLAHEIGHARMGHPGLLMLLAVIVPLMLLAPLQLLDIEHTDVVVQACVLVVVALLIWISVRTLARRFEYEADVSSVRALGAEPCSRALSVVSSMTRSQSLSMRKRLMSLHPDEQQRLQLMRRYESDASFRDQFDRRTTWLRRCIGFVVVAAISTGAWFWSVNWQYERVLLCYYSGDYVGARQSLAAIGEQPVRWQDALGRLEGELTAGLELAPDARDWATVEQRLIPVAWQRGEQVLLAKGPTAARRWFALATSVMPTPTTTEYAIYEFCRAAADGDSQRMSALAQIVKRRGVPESLTPVFKDY